MDHESHDCPQVNADGLAEVETLAKKLDIEFKGDGELGGWTGGKVVLVPTDKPIGDWVPIAERVLE
jgi:2',3'-cyclic-nucleotide 3'-phosphodiesterase